MSSESAKVTAKQLHDVAWPQCSKHCALIEHLGAGECESACPHKFAPAADRFIGSRLYQAYLNDTIVRAVHQAGGDHVDMINELVTERKRLVDLLVQRSMCEPPREVYVPTSNSPPVRECPGHEGHCDMGGVGGSQGG